MDRWFTIVVTHSHDDDDDGKTYIDNIIMKWNTQSCDDDSSPEISDRNFWNNNILLCFMIVRLYLFIVYVPTSLTFGRHTAEEYWIANVVYYIIIYRSTSIVSDQYNIIIIINYYLYTLLALIVTHNSHEFQSVGVYRLLHCRSIL